MISDMSTENSQATSTSTVKEDSNLSTATRSGPTQNNLFRRVPPFSVQRLFNSLSQKHAAQPAIIKQEYNLNLERLSLCKLNELLKKQEKIIQNKTLLAKLKDKGEKAIIFHKKLLDAIKLKEDVNKIEDALGNLNLEPSENAQIKSKTNILDKPLSIGARFNVPKKDVPLKKHCDTSHDEREIKVLDLKESLSTLELTSKKSRIALSEQILRFSSHSLEESGESDFDDEDDSDVESEYSNNHQEVLTNDGK